MSRIRSIHPGLFTDEAFVSVSMTARILALGIWTECDDHGVFEWKPLVLKMKIFPADNVDVGPLLAELVAANIVQPFSELGKQYGAVRNFCKYQHPQKPLFRHPFPDELRAYVYLENATTVPLPYQYDTGTVVGPLMEKKKKKKKEEEKKERFTRSRASDDLKKNRPERDEKFEEFKKAYPKRKGGNPWKPAQALFDRAVKSGTDADHIIAALRNGIGYDPSKRDTEYIPQAVKWLRDERWKDLPAPPAGARPAYFTPPPGCQSHEEILASYGVSNGHPATEVRSDARLGKDRTD